MWGMVITHMPTNVRSDLAAGTTISAQPIPAQPVVLLAAMSANIVLPKIVQPDSMIQRSASVALLLRRERVAKLALGQTEALERTLGFHIAPP